MGALNARKEDYQYNWTRRLKDQGKQDRTIGRVALLVRHRHHSPKPGWNKALGNQIKG